MTVDQLYKPFAICCFKYDLAFRTYRMRVGTHSILGCLEVNGDATEASASESEIPA